MFRCSDVRFVITHRACYPVQLHNKADLPCWVVLTCSVVNLQLLSNPWKHRNMKEITICFDDLKMFLTAWNMAINVVQTDTFFNNVASNQWKISVNLNTHTVCLISSICHYAWLSLSVSTSLFLVIDCGIVGYEDWFFVYGCGKVHKLMPVCAETLTQRVSGHISHSQLGLLCDLSEARRTVRGSA